MSPDPSISSPRPGPAGPPSAGEEEAGGGTWHQFSRLLAHIEARVVGQQRAVLHLLAALLADGHVLLEGAPGLAKTRVARLIADAFEGRFSRIQFTPDLLPSDLTGSMIYDQQAHRFEFEPGPLFANFVLADEINRAPAKVQSALLEAMEERQITAGRESHPLDAPFFVIATQNPIEHEGTWELPQAQLDRFLLHVTVEYPDREVEREILDLAMEEARSGAGLAPDGAAGPDPISGERLARAREQVVAIHVAEPIRDYVVRLVAATRNDPRPYAGVGEHLSHPVSPRGSIALVRSAQARAWLLGRDHVLPEDVAALAPDALRHRMGLTYRAEADGVRAEEVVRALLEQVALV